MVEKDFVSAIMASIVQQYPDATVIRPADNYTLGIPDVLAWIPTMDIHPWSVAIEAKAVNPLMEDPFHQGRRTGVMLRHEFTGPQISLLRKLKKSGVTAFGLVRASADLAFRIEPEDIPARTGNFMHQELLEFPQVRRVTGRWTFWESR